MSGRSPTGRGTDAANVKQFEQGWTSSESTRYDEGGTTATDYAGLDLIDQQRRNAVARSPQLENVYSRWDLSPDWNRKASGQDATLAGPDLFPRYDAGAIDPVPWLARARAACPALLGARLRGRRNRGLGERAGGRTARQSRISAPFVLLARPDSPGEYLLATDVGRIADTEPAGWRRASFARSASRSGLTLARSGSESAVSPSM